jgi:hypothetical protein
VSLADDFASEYIGHTVDLMRFAEGVRERLLGRLFMLRDELIEKILALEGVESGSARERAAKLRKLLERTQNTIKTTYKDLRDEHLSEMVDMSRLEARFVPELFEDAFSISVISSPFTVERLRVIAKKSLIRGSPSEIWWARQATGLRQKFEDEMRLGFLQNETVHDLVKRVRGTATGARHQYEWKGKKRTFVEFEGGIMDTGTRQAEALVRTSVHSIANDVRLASYSKNADIIKGLQAIATLDTRTTDICRARDHHAWYLETLKPIPPTKEPWPGPPGWHWGCRTTLIPLTWSWAELAARAKASKAARTLARKIDKNIPEGTRASMDGQVSKELKYEDWLKGQPEDVQRDVLGPGRYNLWKSKGLTFEQMVDQRGNSLTLEELAKKQAHR